MKLNKKLDKKPYHILVVGAGFTGLSFAYQLLTSKKWQGLRLSRPMKITLIEQDKTVGGLAGAFWVKKSRLDKFYHHWFTNDNHVMDLIKELQLSSQILLNPTNTGMYIANRFFKLSTPWDLLRFKPLSFIDRVRLGLLAILVRLVKNWQKLENKTASEWLIRLGGKKVYQVVWQPLLVGKFGNYAEKISAVWMWNKLKLRGGSRGKGGAEQLAYFKGGFIELAEALAMRIKQLSGKIILNQRVINIGYHKIGGWQVITNKQTIAADLVVATNALPQIADLLQGVASPKYNKILKRIEYLANVCLVLELNHSLSATYWLNVNDPSFPFVAVIEHTNFQPKNHYHGRHIVYLSKYLPHDDKIYNMSDAAVFQFALPHIQKMFPHFQKNWVLKYHVWRERYAQPIVEKNYSQLIPPSRSPYPNFYICSMAQIYPEDRGTNYAIRSGRQLGEELAADLVKALA